MPIPPTGWGAVESLIWDYKIALEKQGHEVQIVNTPDLNQVIVQCSSFTPDAIHVQYDDFVHWTPQLKAVCPNLFITSHYGYIHQPHRFEGHYWNIFNNFISQDIKIISLTPESANLYIQHGKNPKDVFVCHNGADVNKFYFNAQPNSGPTKALYLGKITVRKRQNLLYSLDGIEFAGNYDGTIGVPFKGYIGEWTKDVLYANLTNYDNLVLLSDGEAHALVICEAFAAGLGVVVSEFAKANLDLNKEFITVIPEHQLFNIENVETAIKNNALLSRTKRLEIRKYAEEVFSWDVIAARYAEILSTGA